MVALDIQWMPSVDLGSQALVLRPVTAGALDAVED